MSDMELPDARARVERFASTPRYQLSDADRAAISRVLAELDRLPRLLPTLEQLKRIQFGPDIDIGSPTCRACGGYKRAPAMDQDYYGKAGCKPDCWIARLTAALEAP